jgi:tRNA splicing endonuclease
MLGNDSTGNRKAETGSHFLLFSREEWIEYLIYNFLRDRGTVIGY